MKEQPRTPILPVERVATILTPPGPAGQSTGPYLCCNRYNASAGNGVACRLFSVNRLDNRAGQDKWGQRGQGQHGQGNTGRATRQSNTTEQDGKAIWQGKTATHYGKATWQGKTATHYGKATWQGNATAHHGRASQRGNTTEYHGRARRQGNTGKENGQESFLPVQIRNELCCFSD